MKRLSVTLCSFLVVLFAPVIVFASDYGLNATAKAANLDKVSTTDLPTLIGNVIGTALSLISVIFFALMIYGGLRWMTARGNEDTSRKALDTIIAAIIGIIIVLASYAITTFVFNSVGATGRPTTPATPTTPTTPTTPIVTTLKENGATCSAAAECTSGLCTGGVCGVTAGAPSCKVDPLAVVHCGQLSPVSPCQADSACEVSGSSCIPGADQSFCSSFMALPTAAESQAACAGSDACYWESGSCKLDPLAVEHCATLSISQSPCQADSACEVSGSSCIPGADQSFCSSLTTQPACAGSDACYWE